MTPAEYKKAVAHRQQMISVNRSRRLKGLPSLDVPPKPERPKVVQLFDTEDGYIGTWPYGVTEHDARIEAEELGNKVGKAKRVDAI